MKALLLLLLIVPAAAFAQNDTVYYFTGKPYHYENVVRVDSSQKMDVLYQKAVEWFALGFNQSNVKMQDEADGIIIATVGYNWQTAPTTVMSTTTTTTKKAWFTVKIQVKDGAYKYEFSNFNASDFGAFTDGLISQYPFMANIPSRYVKQLHTISDNNLVVLQKTTVKTTQDAIAQLAGYMNKPLKDNF